MKRLAGFSLGLLIISWALAACRSAAPPKAGYILDLPDVEIRAAYERAAAQNVLAAINPKVFPGYFSVCADGKDFGYGNSYPSLDGHQMTDALLWLGQVDVVKANWDYVRKFQRPDGQLPLAILPAEAGKMIGAVPAPVDANGGLYRHWVPGDPLRALAGPTFIQNADVIFRFTQDRGWLLQQLPSINLTADYLAGLTTTEGAVKGAGYYIERPTRVEYDGVAQCHAMDAFRRVAELNAIAGRPEAAKKYGELASRVETYVRTRFWLKDRFAEYIHPERGVIASHGLTDVDWSAIATGVATAEQRAALWPQLKEEKRFYYGGMPTGIATLPQSYEKWESTYGDTMDLAAMGRVWYLESWARARMGDAQGLLESIQRVCKVGRENGYYWRERYNEKGGYGAHKYCEYPANLIRIVQRFLLGVEFRLDGTLVLAPTAPADFWKRGFGQTLSWRDRSLQYRMEQDRITGTYWGGSQQLAVRLAPGAGEAVIRGTIDGQNIKAEREGDLVLVTLPSASARQACRFEIALDLSAPRQTSAILHSYEELIHTKLTRYSGNPIIRHSGKTQDWKDGQVQESIVFNDPKDRSKLIMYYSGYRHPFPAGTDIGIATADLANPFVWTDFPSNPILSSGSNLHNKVWMRLDSMLYLDGEYWLYSTGKTQSSGDSIQLARSRDGVHFVWHEKPVLLPSGDENDVSQAAVLKEGNLWYMYYSYRTRSGRVLPGIRLATSADGLHWNKTGQQILSGTPGSYDSRYYEWHQILKLGMDYVLLSECFDGKHWCVGAAHSTSPLTGWIKKDTPLFERSGVPGTFDVHHVATPAIYEAGSRVMLFYCGGGNLADYMLSKWDIGVAYSGELTH
jgi:predicted GH43/DUF377 family glycosyl hydrolase